METHGKKTNLSEVRIFQKSNDYFYIKKYIEFVHITLTNRTSQNSISRSIMAVTSGASFVLSSILTVLLFSGMQMYKSWLVSTQLHTILGGYIGSMLFVLILTALGNLESTMFGKSFQLKLFPEVFISLIVSLIASGLVHRVATTTCFIFSMIALYYINRISQETYSTPSQQPPATLHTKKRK